MHQTVPIFDVALYHRNCLDGFTSLLVAYAAGILRQGNALWFHAAGADERSPPPHLNKTKNVLIMDVNMSYDLVKEIVTNTNITYMIDHHTNKDHQKLLNLQKEQPQKFVYMFDANNNAATIVWKWLSPKSFGGKSPPRFLDFIRDNDMGLWVLPNTQAFILGLEVKYNIHYGLSREMTYKKLNKWKKLLDDEPKIDKLISLGEKLKKHQDLIMERLEINTEVVEMTNAKTNKKCKVAISNGCVYLAKKLAVRLAKKMRNEVDMAIVWYYNVSTSMIQCVVRSDTQDILWLPQMYGGGGHPSAGTFSYPAKHIYEWLTVHEKRVSSKPAAAGGAGIKCCGFDCF